MAKTKALTKWDAKLAAMAQQSVKNVDHITGGGNIIGTAGGILKYRGAEIPGNRFRAVILWYIPANMWYEGNYDPGSPDVPACFAFGGDDIEMAPHEKSRDPQHETCAGCPMNEWGSADRGQGKACKNSIRIGLISEGDLENIASAEIAYVHVPVTSVRGWAGYVRKVSEGGGLALCQVVTEIVLEKDPKVQFKMLFDSKDEVPSSVMEELVAKVEECQKAISFPYIAVERAEQPARGARGRGAARGRTAQASVPPARKPAAGRGARPSKF